MLNCASHASGLSQTLQIVALAVCKPFDEPVNEYVSRLRKIFPLNPVEPNFSFPPISRCSATLVASSQDFESQKSIDARSETELQSRIKLLQTNLERAEADAEVANIKLRFYATSSFADKEGPTHTKSGSDSQARKRRKAETEKNNDAGARKKKKKSDDKNESCTGVDLETIVAHLASSKHILYVVHLTGMELFSVPQTPPVSHSIHVLSALEEYAIDFHGLSAPSDLSPTDLRHNPSNPPLRVHFSRVITSVADLVRHTLDLPLSFGHMDKIAESFTSVKKPRTTLRAASLLFSRIAGAMGTAEPMCCNMIEQVVETIIYPLIRSIHICSVRRTSNLLAALQSNEANMSTNSTKIDLRHEVVSMLSRIGCSWKCAAHRGRMDTFTSSSNSEVVPQCLSLHGIMMLMAALEVFRVCTVSDDTTSPSQHEEQCGSHTLSSHSQLENPPIIPPQSTQDARVDGLQRVMAREETIWFLCAFIRTCMDALQTGHGTTDETTAETRNVLLSVLLVDRRAKKLESQTMVSSKTSLNEVEAGLIFAAIEAINDACACPWESEKELDLPNLMI